mmetsp:Transcript_96717/g.211499  ORF Transcript_96717/g.211499 Transcript_96717/m.211499 type:complete len:203 (-) Transcript_96717:54-662(-)
MAGYGAAQLRGLKKAPQLNDQLVLVKGLVESAESRWLVELESGEEKSIHNDNLLTTLDAGATLLLERGCVAHVTVGRTAYLAQMDQEEREHLDEVLEAFSTKFDVRTELNLVEGWPQASIVIRGHPDEVLKSLEEIGKVFERFKMPFRSSKCRGPIAGSASARADEVNQEVETVEVEGMTVNSLEKRERRRGPKVDRYGRPT